jgi:hypothetical protein
MIGHYQDCPYIDLNARIGDLFFQLLKGAGEGAEGGLAMLQDAFWWPPMLLESLGYKQCCYGMEEVIGSIPIRSTNKPNNLADSQKKRDTLSIRWSHAASSAALSTTFFERFERTSTTRLCASRLAQSLCVNVHCRGDVGWRINSCTTFPAPL